METLKQLDDFFSLEISFLRTNTPKSKEEIDLKTIEIDKKIAEYKKTLISLRDEISPQEYNKIFNGLKEDMVALQSACRDFISKFKDENPDPPSSDEEYGNVDELKFDKNSLKVANAGKNKNKTIKTEYEFPMEAAMNCIPDFNGQPEDLNCFIDQINYFYGKLPKNESHIPLINVIKLKLKGEAKPFANNISNLTWEIVEGMLREEFKNKNISANIFKTISTLSQKQNESFKSYKNRVLQIFLEISSNDNADNNSLILKNLKMYFIAGLQNVQLQQTARSIATNDFKEFLITLEKHCISNEEFEDIQKHVQRLNLQPSKNMQGNSYNNNRNYTRQYQQNNPNTGNRNFNNYNGQQQQRQNPNFGYNQNRQNYNQNHNSYNQAPSYNSNRSNENRNQYSNANRGNYSPKHNSSYNSNSFYPQRKN